MLWRKPAKMTYCDMCIWIDDSGVIPRIADNPGMYPQDENLVYNYLYLLCRMLSPKHAPLPDRTDYEPFGFFAANFYYFQLIKNWRNRGTYVKGRLIQPIKNLLDYIKHTLRLRRNEYQEKFYLQRISEEINGNFDFNKYQQNLKDEAAASYYRSETLQYIKSSLNSGELEKLLDETLKSTHLIDNSVDYKNLKISIVLNTLNIFKKNKKLVAIQPDMPIIVWHLPKSLSKYIMQLTNEFFIKLHEVISYWFDTTRADDLLLTKMVANPGGNYEDSAD